MNRLDAYVYGCSIYEELRLMFIDMGMTVDINNYIGQTNARDNYKNAIDALNPSSLSKGIMLYPLGDFNYKVTRVNSIFINYLTADDRLNQSFDVSQDGIRQDLSFKINILAQNYKDAELISSMVHAKFRTHSGHRVYDLDTDTFSNDWLYSIAETSIEINKLVKVDLDHYTEYIISFTLHQVPILFPQTSTITPIQYGVFQNLYTYIDLNANGFYELII